MAEISYRRHRFPPVIIQHAVWLYLRNARGMAPSRQSRFLRLGHRLFAPTVKQDQVFRAALLETDTGSRFREACARFLYSACHLMVRHSLLPTFFVLYRTHV